ncbi:butyrophilin subfamily 1 member A1-like isoform X2 [Pleurodeles waltl]
MFSVIGPDQIIDSTVGEDALLRCDLSPRMSAEHMLVTWHKTEASLAVHTYRDGIDVDEGKDPAYLGRTELIKDGIMNGSVALKIRQVRVSDEGQYSCFFKSDTCFNSAVMKMNVTGSESDPVIQVDVLQGGGMQVECRAEGWYPQPEVLWKGDNGKVLSSSFSNVGKDDNGLYNIKSAIPVNRNVNQNVSCHISNVSRNQRRVSKMFFSDSVFLKDSSWTVAFCVFFILALFFLILLVWYRRKSQKKKCSLKDGWKEERDHLLQKIENLEEEKRTEMAAVSEELKWRRGLRNAVRYHHVILDQGTAHPQLRLSDDGRHVRWDEVIQELPVDSRRFEARACVLGSEGINSERHYWKMEVGADCVVGVAQISVNRKTPLSPIPSHGIFAVSLRGGFVRVKASEEPLELNLKEYPHMIGIYLDCDQGEMSFYNGDSMEHIYTCKIPVIEVLFPFFYLGPGTEIKL